MCCRKRCSSGCSNRPSNVRGTRSATPSGSAGCSATWKGSASSPTGATRRGNIRSSRWSRAQLRDHEPHELRTERIGVQRADPAVGIGSLPRHRGTSTEPIRLDDEQLVPYAGRYETIASILDLRIEDGGLVMEATVRPEVLEQLGEEEQYDPRTRSACCPVKATDTSSPTARRRACAATSEGIRRDRSKGCTWVGDTPHVSADTESGMTPARFQRASWLGTRCHHHVDSVLPRATSDGVGIECGIAVTVKATSVPGSTSVPGAGSCLTTSSALGSPNLLSSVIPIVETTSGLLDLSDGRCDVQPPNVGHGDRSCGGNLTQRSDFRRSKPGTRRDARLGKRWLHLWRQPTALDYPPPARSANRPGQRSVCPFRVRTPSNVSSNPNQWAPPSSYSPSSARMKLLPVWPSVSSSHVTAKGIVMAEDSRVKRGRGYDFERAAPLARYAARGAP